MVKVFATTKNSGPSWSSDPLTLVYLGTSLDDAQEAVGDFRKYRREVFPERSPEIYSAIPRAIEREWVDYYMADGWWYSIVSFDL